MTGEHGERSDGWRRSSVCATRTRVGRSVATLSQLGRKGPPNYQHIEVDLTSHSNRYETRITLPGSHRLIGPSAISATAHHRRITIWRASPILPDVCCVFASYSSLQLVYWAFQLPSAQALQKPPNSNSGRRGSFIPSAEPVYTICPSLLSTSLLHSSHPRSPSQHSNPVIHLASSARARNR